MKNTILRALSLANRASDLVLNRFDYPVLVLMYHRVLESCHGKHQYAVTTGNFCNQLNYIESKFELLRFEDDWSNISRPGCVITFDDGYYDNYLIARDYLEPSAVPATFFITTQNLDTEEMFWWDKLLLNKDFYLEVTQRPFTEIERQLKNSSPEAINAFFSKYPKLQQESSSVRERFRSMTSSELHDLSKLKCSTIGAHTVNHPRLTILDEQSIFEELSVSKRVIENIIDAEVPVCSFPFGAYNHRVLKVCKRLGFKKTATTSERNAYCWQNTLKVPRINVENMGIDQFKQTIEKRLTYCK